MASPYSTSQSIVADFVPTLPSPSNPHSIISSESESSPAISQQTYLSPHSIIPSSDAGLSSPASSSATAAATTTRSPQTVSTGPDHPDSKYHYQTPVIYDAYAVNNSNSNLNTVAGSPGLWSQSTDVYYPPPPFQCDDQGQYAKATIQQPQLQQPQQQQQHQIFQPQYQQQQQYQQYHQQQQPPSAQSFPMYPVGHPNTTTTISHNVNDPDHHKPPTDTTHMEILGSGQQYQPDKNKSKKKKKKKCICFFILFPVIIGIVLGIVFGVILKKNNNDGDKPPNPSTSGSGGSSSTTTTTTATGYYPYPTGMPDMVAI
ncbi:hypothetical protein EC957_006147 [Mortierella hygrophila]|uniref:Uncharacterized protein n=1 Tax=Mortierella hygrophila TaxID=979708 RepID=A0A9P6FED3_9FUNG|nr:hypothetical protein EC957_006147 [Mortierella hygrophila]